MVSVGYSGCPIRLSAFDYRYVMGESVRHSFRFAVRLVGFYLYVRGGKPESAELAETYY